LRDKGQVGPGEKVLINSAAGGVGTFAVQIAKAFGARRNQEDLIAMSELMAAGKVTPVIDRTYPLSETAKAFRYLQAGHARGKVVITI
jgi:NADPH:quinone reductase-like Zn-dependent oxidoreductase